MRPTSSPDASVAMRPMTVRSPVLITIPRAVPAARIAFIFLHHKQNTTLLLNRFDASWLRTFNTVGGEEGDVPGLQWVLIREVRSASLRLRFTSQRGVVHLGKSMQTLINGKQATLKKISQWMPIAKRDRDYAKCLSFKKSFHTAV